MNLKDAIISIASHLIIFVIITLLLLLAMLPTMNNAHALSVNVTLNNTAPLPESRIAWNVQTDAPLDYSLAIDGAVFQSGLNASNLTIEKLENQDFNATRSWHFTAVNSNNSSETASLNGSYKIQDLALQVAPIPVSNNGTFTVTGRFSYSGGLGLNNTAVEVDSELCGLQKAWTDVNGNWSRACNFDDYADSGDYGVTVTAFYDLYASRSTSVAVHVNGLTSTIVLLETPANPSTDTFDANASWSVDSGSPVANISIKMFYNNTTITKDCPFVTGNFYSSCAKQFTLLTPTVAGAYPIAANFSWTDRQDVLRYTLINNTLTIGSIVDVVIQDLMFNQSVGTRTKTNLTINGSQSNTPVYISFPANDYFLIDSMKIEAGETWLYPITSTIPYSMDRNELKGKLEAWDTNHPERKFDFFYDVNILQPILSFAPQAEVEVTGTELTVNLTLVNTGAPFHNASFGYSCPQYWTCSASPSTLETVNDNASIQLTLKPSVTEPKGLTKIQVTASDNYGRSASIQVPVKVNLAPSVNASSKYVTDTVAYGISYADNVFFITDAGIVFKSTPEQAADVAERAVRVSDLSPLIVSLDAKSEGIGDVCDVWVRVGISNYKLTPGGTNKFPVESKVGDKVYEYLVAHKEGVCLVKIDYNDQSTEAYVVFAGAPPDTNKDQQPMTKKDGKDLFDAVSAEKDNILNVVMLLFGGLTTFVMGGLLLFVYPKIHPKLSETRYPVKPPEVKFERKNFSEPRPLVPTRTSMFQKRGGRSP